MILVTHSFGGHEVTVVVDVPIPTLVADFSASDAVKSAFVVSEGRLRVEYKRRTIDVLPLVYGPSLLAHIGKGNDAAMKAFAIDCGHMVFPECNSIRVVGGEVVRPLLSEVSGLKGKFYYWARRVLNEDDFGQVAYEAWLDSTDDNKQHFEEWFESSAPLEQSKNPFRARTRWWWAFQGLIEMARYGLTSITMNQVLDFARQAGAPPSIEVDDVREVIWMVDDRLGDLAEVDVDEWKGVFRWDIRCPVCNSLVELKRIRKPDGNGGWFEVPTVERCIKNCKMPPFHWQNRVRLPDAQKANDMLWPKDRPAAQLTGDFSSWAEKDGRYTFGSGRFPEESDKQGYMPAPELPSGEETRTLIPGTGRAFVDDRTFDVREADDALLKAFFDWREWCAAVRSGQLDENTILGVMLAKGDLQKAFVASFRERLRQPTNFILDPVPEQIAEEAHFGEEVFKELDTLKRLAESPPPEPVKTIASSAPDLEEWNDAPTEAVPMDLPTPEELHDRRKWKEPPEIWLYRRQMAARGLVNLRRLADDE